MPNKVTSLSITDSGYGYKLAPSVTISAPTLDSDSASASSIISTDSDFRIGSVRIDSGGAYYLNAPTVTFDLPTADSQVASAICTIDSNGSIVSVSLTDSGMYYTSAPDITIEDIQTPHGNWVTQRRKWGERSFGLRINTPFNVDYEMTNFSSNGKKYPMSLEFWVNFATQNNNGTIMYFPTDVDPDGSDNKVTYNGARRFTWHWTEDSGTTSRTIQSGLAVTQNVWHFVQLVKSYDSGVIKHSMYIDGDSHGYYIADSSAGQDLFIDDKIVLNNSQASMTYTYVDAVRLDVGDSTDSAGALTVFTTPPTTNRDPGTDSNYANFEVDSAEISATIANGRVNTITIVKKGNRFPSVPTLTFDSPTGTVYDFRATGVATIDSDLGGQVTKITLTDSGMGYDSAPSITFDSPQPFGTAEDYRAKAITTIDSFGQIDTLTITKSGGGYITAPTVTIAAAPDLVFNQNDSATQTLSTGVKVSGEIIKYSDSDAKLYLAHVNADDGKYHSFTTTEQITMANPGKVGITRDVISVEELNNISQNEQNDDFETISDDFLDFSETNPFGDPN